MCGRGKSECLCRNYRFYYSGLAAPFYYEGVIGKSIRNFKFRGRIGYAGFFAHEMADTVNKQFAGKSFDLIVCVPLTKKSYKIRGYNQSFLLAKEIAAVLNIEIRSDLLVKLYDTPAQHTMTSSMRRGNLAGVFDVAEPDFAKGKTILICDDVATTGSTINECAKMLLLYGAKEVCCITAAVTRKAK
jgi:ComF family protein